MKISVRLFGGLVTHAGTNELVIDLDHPATVDALRKAVSQQVPAIANLMPSVKVAVDLEIAADDLVLTADHEVALLPPVAGGSTDGDPPDAPGAELDVVTIGSSRIVTGLMAPPLPVDAAIDAVSDPTDGAVAVFLGKVRNHSPDLADVVTLEYSAYPDMANKVLADLARNVAADYPDINGVVLLHAVGTLPVGAHTILIVCTSAHRQQAFSACEDALERVKLEVPVWKRERSAQGTDRWVGLPSV